MRCFFIDLENVRSYGLEGILLLKPDDKVYVFYSDNANTLTIPTIESLNESSAQVKYIKTNYIGANAMDFQIVTLLGASIEKEKTGHFYIISHDNGFKSAVKFCEGFFTGYEIVTGVFANILLAINSERNISQQNKKSVDKISKGRKNNKKSVSESSDSLNTDTDHAITNNNDGISDDPKAAEISQNGENNDGIKEKQTGRRNRTRRKKENNSKKNDIGPNENNVPVQTEDSMDNIPTQNNLNSGTENTVSSLDKESNNPLNDVSEKEKNKNRGRNHRRRGKIRDKSEEISETYTDNADSADESDEKLSEASEDGFMIIQASKNQKKEGRRRRSGKKEKIDNKTTNAAKDNLNRAQNDISKEVSASRNYKYVYNALADFLSKSTIDMYAAKIDEGIRNSANRNELHQFFKKNYGTDEAEALYKIIYSDFEKMKKAIDD